MGVEEKPFAAARLAKARGLTRKTWDDYNKRGPPVKKSHSTRAAIWRLEPLVEVLGRQSATFTPPLLTARDENPECSLRGCERSSGFKSPRTFQARSRRLIRSPDELAARGESALPLFPIGWGLQSGKAYERHSVQRRR